MPTMTNPETGETIEISEEEFLDALRSGRASIQQKVVNADGSTSTSSLFGNMANDGLDHSLNIFTDTATFNAFWVRYSKRISGKLEETEAERNAAEKYAHELYEMTVDFTDTALMGILRKTSDKLTINVYVRDERKTITDQYIQGSRSWDLNKEGEFCLSPADVKGDEKYVTFYMLSFLEMRTLLRTNGMLEEIKELGNRGSGVVITASGEGENAVAKIVISSERPDLPCKFMGFGEETLMRPYLDELFGDTLTKDALIQNKIRIAEAGDSDSQAYLAEHYMKQGMMGDDSEKNYVESIKWAEKAVEQKNTSAMWTMALAYEHGRGVKKDPTKAYKFYKMGADLGDAACLNSLGNYYMQGVSVKKDPIKGFQLMLQSAQKGYGLAMRNVGNCYQFGNGTKENMRKAIEWYEKSLEVEFDPQLAQKVQIFKTLPDLDDVDSYSDETEEPVDHKKIAENLLKEWKSVSYDYLRKSNEICDDWQQVFDEMNNNIASRIMRSQAELTSALRSVVRKRNLYGPKIDRLISQIDKDGMSFIDRGADYRLMQDVVDLISKIEKQAVDCLSLEFGATGTMTGSLGEDNFTLSSASKAIQQNWRKKYDESPEIKRAKERDKIITSITYTKKKIEKLKKEQEGFPKKEADTTAEISKLEKELADFKASLSNKREQIEQSSAKQQQAKKQEINEMTERKEGLQNNLENVLTQIQGLSIFKRSLKKELNAKGDELRNMIVSLQEQIESAESKLDAIIAAKNKNVQSLVEEETAMHGRITKLKKTLEGLRTKYNQNEKNISRLEEQLDNNQRRLGEIEA